MLKTTTFGDVTRFDLARTFGGRGLYWTTAYYVDGMQIDTGCAHAAREMVQALKGRPLLRIFNTHSHEDHIGANGLLQHQHPGLEILAHRLAVPVLADPRGRQPLHPYRKLFWGWPQPSIACPVDEQVRIQTPKYSFQLFFTPGHAPDHFCLYEPDQGWLFTGDLFVGGRERALREGYEIWQIIASLKQVASLPVSIMFPSSARVREHPAEELRSKIAYLEDLGGKVLERSQKGWSVDAIARDLLGKPSLVEAVTLGNFSRRHLVLSYLRNTGASPA